MWKLVRVVLYSVAGNRFWSEREILKNLTILEPKTLLSFQRDYLHINIVKLRIDGTKNHHLLLEIFSIESKETTHERLYTRVANIFSLFMGGLIIHKVFNIHVYSGYFAGLKLFTFNFQPKISGNFRFLS